MYGRRRSLLLLLSLILLCLIWLLYLSNESASKAPPSPYSRKIVKVSIAINSLAENDAIARCLKSHDVQNRLHGYHHHILKRALVAEGRDYIKRPPGIWSKPAYMLQLLLAELVKPEEERVEWLFWFDADTLILNPHIKLETFLPSTSLSEDSATDHITSQIHLIITQNWDGINSGAYLLRVHPWSVTLLTAQLAFQTYKPDDYLPVREQSALSYLLFSNPKFMANWTAVPSRWFNSFPVNTTYDVEVHRNPMTESLFDDGAEYPDSAPWKVVRGDMALHFAGFFSQRDSWIPPWADRCERYDHEWSGGQFQTKMQQRAYDFWAGWIVERRRAFADENSGEVKRRLQTMSEEWLTEYEKRLMRISDLETMVIVGADAPL